MQRGNNKKTFDINSSTQRKIRKLEGDMINKALNDEPSTCNVSNVPSNISTFEIIENDSHASITFNQDEIDADLSNEINDFDQTDRKSVV